MIQKRNCILVYSDMNTWIDFCILVSDKDFNQAMQVTTKAYDDCTLVVKQRLCYDDLVNKAWR